MLNSSGNQDICYFNFKCANHVGILSDFNHVFSNIGYVALGVLFAILTYFRKKWHKEEVARDYNIQKVRLARVCTCHGW